jgi:hypothetical protein
MEIRTKTNSIPALRRALIREKNLNNSHTINI